MSIKKNCMDCSKRTDRDTCSMKEMFQMNFKLRGAIYGKNTGISYEEEIDCTYFEKKNR